MAYYILEKSNNNIDLILTHSNKIYTLELGDYSTLDDFQFYLYFQGALLTARVRLSACKSDTNKLDKMAEYLVKVFKDKVPLNNKPKKYRLTLLQVAYSQIKAKSDPFKHWNDLTNPKIIEEIYLSWDSLTRREQNQLRKNPYIQKALAELEITALESEYII